MQLHVPYNIIMDKKSPLNIWQHELPVKCLFIISRPAFDQNALQHSSIKNKILKTRDISYYLYCIVLKLNNEQVFLGYFVYI